VACVRPSMALTHACTCEYPTAEAVILIPPLSIIGVFAGSVYDCLALLSPLNVSTPQGTHHILGHVACQALILRGDCPLLHVGYQAVGRLPQTPIHPLLDCLRLARVAHYAQQMPWPLAT